MKRAIFVAFFAAVLIFGDAEAADSVEAIIELGYHYTFEIDSSFAPWSYAFPASETRVFPFNISDNGSNVYKVLTNRTGDRLFVIPEPLKWFDEENPTEQPLYRTLSGDALLRTVYCENPIWSTDDNFIGVWAGTFTLNKMPYFCKVRW